MTHGVTLKRYTVKNGEELSTYENEIFFFCKARNFSICKMLISVEKVYKCNDRNIVKSVSGG